MNSRIYLSPPHMSGNEHQYINEAFRTNWVAPLGPNVDEFEQQTAAAAGAKGAVALSSGTAAIHLALALLDISTGDKVFCSTLTFVASANPILYQGAEPVFIDSEPQTWNMSPQALQLAMEEAALKGRLPKAVIIVNLYGQSAKMDELAAICDRFGVPIIEDAAESFGSTYKGKPSGSFGKFGVFSFNGNKIITTSGGGMIVSNDLEALERARFLATQSRDQATHYQHSQLGYNYRMSNLLAGVGIAQLQVLELRVAARRKIFSRYKKELGHIPGLTFMPELPQTKTNRWLSTLTINEEVTRVSVKDILSSLSEQNIEARQVWKPLHLQPLFKDAAYYRHNQDEDIAEELFNTGICLPSGSNLSEDDQTRVITQIKDVLQGAAVKRGAL
ncbi:aminotransferase class I/II-fold pyridoxal phosphate-dependent enzyme [Jeotgalibacillus sp. S-D1]|uniref:DegT/DnrJ/EryC1/StrS family aminotransferase n=1 Tax=Jeotgalibacillus sp. S-D1 TaxID=2552189 RepID=UPI00105A0F4B|nr:aminotransferase class I/II-fold pyridoxal phosphate-dependent enzyme [Jeotgalibacillus sp. S-D1]TDL31819.1 aminotransferase class I/II-fold pyridoxal phosphate-dependent enzyme [Jeotgalibacillus sp. S-D1]